VERAIPSINISFSFQRPDKVLAKIIRDESESKYLYELNLNLRDLFLLRGLNELLCLDTLVNVEKYWYQIEVAKRAIREFGGRVILADEVGLGKTIEAGMVIKEYLMRGMVSQVLILTPPSLVSQWQEEMLTKFGLYFAITDGVNLEKDSSFWSREKLIISSLNLAKSASHFNQVTANEYDLVVVDEVHHLKNRTTLNWKLVNNLKSRFLLLISATPVQNNLIELFNLITLLKPGLLKTEAGFKREYVKRGDLRTPINQEKLKRLLKDVMIRNTRPLVEVKLPRRFASTIIVPPSKLEEQIYHRISDMARESYQRSKGTTRLILNTLLREAGSSPYALRNSLLKLNDIFSPPFVSELLGLIGRLDSTEKERYLLELLAKGKGKKIIFTNYVETLRYLAQSLSHAGFQFVELRGDLTSSEKEKAIQVFRDQADILLAMESGGEGRNIQFCNTMINYDLPWNPMRIEQRIGRIHRIGQTRDVFIFNLCLKGSIEEYILEVLDKKINMFELVIGEMDAILGNLPGEVEFENIVIDIWMRSQNEAALREGFNQLGELILKAKKSYQETNRWDEVLFGNNFGV